MKQLLGISVFTVLLLSTQVIYADTMTNDSFRVDKSSVSDDLPTLTPTPKNVLQIQQSNVPDNLQSEQTLESSSAFTVSFSDSSISFGSFYPTDPILRTEELIITPGSTNGYAIMQYENHSLTSADSQVIPDTTCDSGICSSHTASIWTNILTYGLGFRCIIQDTPCDGISDSSSYYRIANTDRHEFPTTLDAQKGQGAQNVALIYKLNTNATQPDGDYQNTVTYIAVPGY